MQTKRILGLLAVTLLTLTSARPAYAHLPGQPPFTYVNGVAAKYYPVGYASLPDLAPPQDLEDGTYVVNQSLEFKLDSNALPYFPEELSSIRFEWDFGDGTKLVGLTVTHSFTKPGSKTVIIRTTDSRNNDPAQTLSTLFLNILPYQGYQLPNPVVRVNGVGLTNLYTNTFSADFTKKVTLDASKSTGGSGSIASIVWDLGNAELSKDAKAVVSYNQIISTVQPVVRVTDSNGLFVDATFQITNSTLAGPNTKAASTPIPRSTSERRRNWLVGGGIALLALLAGLILVRRRHAPHRKR